MTAKKNNRLINEKSPYLLQHASNPVDWFPWGAEAFAKAKRENKPIFISIGYSTCHWCHVMEHESFADAEVARLMNDYFVSIKVDREERPDIDNTYMKVAQMISGGGGWPLNIITTPEKRPFFATTYIPKDNKHGRLGMMGLIQKVKDLWETSQDDIVKSASDITTALCHMSPKSSESELAESTLHAAFEQIEASYDHINGGIGQAPKFPMPHNMLFLLRYWKRTGSDRALEMVEKMLTSIRRGGIYDHIGYGVHRYSTDSAWLVPHFEKMLYDQAMLAMAYVETYQATGNNEYKKSAKEIFYYVLRDMTSNEGAFFTAEDADSEGEEGLFYLWKEDEIRKILNKDDADLAIKVFNIEKEGNFIDQVIGHKTGHNIFHLTKTLDEIAKDLNMDEYELATRIELIRKIIFSCRERRTHPYKDDKVLTDWNGLMIAALAKGAQAFNDNGYVEDASRAARFILNKMRTEDGRLLHRYRDGEAMVQGNINDYSFFIWGLIELYNATFDIDFLKSALDLNSDMLNHFWDEGAGGFFFTADDAEELLIRQKEIYDGAIPSGNSVAMSNLLRLGRMTADGELEDKAIKLGQAFSGQVVEAPSAYTQMLAAVDFAVGPSYEVVIAGDSRKKETKLMSNKLMEKFIPNKVVVLRPTENELSDIYKLIKSSQYYTSIDGKPTAYVCENYNCRLPTTDVGKMLELLNSK